MVSTLMGLFEDSGPAREMYWFGPSEFAYERGCVPSPIMPHAQHEHPHNTQFPPTHLETSNGAFCHSESAPLTPSSSTSSVSSVTPHPPFVSPGSDRSQYISPSSVENESTGIRSPCPSTIGPQDLSSSSVSTTTSSTVCHATTSITANSGEVSFCAGCHDRIIDRFYLLAVERRWHAGCLRCSICHLPFDTATTCFAKDGHIFCKDDYHKFFSIRHCARCGRGIGSSELVMRAREFVYHVQCFSCAHCDMQLTKGDHFGMHGPLIYCRDHYQIPNAMDANGQISPIGIPPPGTFQGPPQMPLGPHQQHSHSHHPHSHLPPEAMQGFPPPEAISKIQFFNGVGAPHKGRPRKKRLKDEPMDTNMNISSGYDIEGTYGPLNSSCQPVRSKRIRTSFKHGQLRIMKTYFQVNHNPDAKDLKQLSSKTQLSKRVLQVWFQNARAKWRRQVVSKDPKALNGGGDGCPSVGQDGSGPDGNGTDYGSASPSTCNPMSPDEEPCDTPPNTQLPYQQMSL